MPSPRAPPPIPPAQRRLYLSSHLRFLDRQTAPPALSSHYRALLLDAGEALGEKIWHFLECTTFALHSLHTVLPTPSGAFWETVTLHVLHGQLDPARTLVAQRLREAPDWPSRVASIRLRDGAIDPLATLEHLLAPRPRQEWPEWQAACASWAGSEELLPHTHARKVMAILAGDEDAIMEAAPDWDTAFVACIVYKSHPPTSRGDMPEYADILFDSFKGDYGSMLNRLDGLLGAFYSAHWADLLHRSDRLPNARREYFVKEYCKTLEQIRGCWRVAVDYYSSCPETGITPLLHLLCRVPIKGAGDPVAEKLLGVCDAVQAGHGAICRRVGEHCRQERNFGGATAWLCRGGMDAAVEELALGALEDAEKGGVCSPGATTLAYVVTALGAYGGEGVRERLLFVRLYHEVQEGLSRLGQGDMECFEEVVMTVRSLLAGGLPKRFWGVLVYDFTNALKTAPGVGRAALMEVLSALELCDHSGLKGRLTHGEDIDCVLGDMRKTLLDCLARC